MISKIQRFDPETVVIVCVWNNKRKKKYALYSSVFSIILHHVSTKVDTISLIMTGKIYFHLFAYFTVNWKYFCLWMILGLSSFQLYINVFYQTCYHREIIGLRSSSPPVVIRYRVSNYNTTFRNYYERLY